MEKNEIEKELNRLRDEKVIESWFSFNSGAGDNKVFKYGVVESRTMTVEETEAFVTKHPEKKRTPRKSKKGA